MRSVILSARHWLKPEPASVGQWLPDWFQCASSRHLGFLQYRPTVFQFHQNNKFIASCFQAGRRAAESDNPLVVFLGVLGGFLMLYTGYRITKWTLGLVWRVVSYPFRGYDFYDYHDRLPTRYRPMPDQRNKKRKSTGPSKGPCLRDSLKSLLQTKLTASGEAKHEVVQASLKVATHMKNGLRKNISYLNFEKNPELVGSTSDGTMVPGQGDCDYLLHVGIPEPTSLEHQGEGYWRLRIDNPSDSIKGLTVRDRDNYYLSPLKLHSLLLGEVSRVAQELQDTSGIVNVKHVSHQAGPALKFKITNHPINARSTQLTIFDMDFVPCVTVNGKQLVTKPHPSLPNEQTRKSREDPDRLRWRQSFSSAERDRIQPLDKGDGGWSKKLYREVKYLRHNQPQFKQFPSFIYKTVFLKQLEEDRYPSRWREQTHEDRFMSYMKKLEAVFERGELNHYFLKKNEGISRNLLQPDFDQEQIRDFRNFLRRINRGGEKAWAKLLQNIT
ncbi:uncharacterized protein LOC135503055 [Lineus longissimus]|uniref:uncharacterized protein LOC135503055 n=1 Tax=Lineus longissimus TaxID=88925 RepID=UPI002B4EE9D3